MSRRGYPTADLYEERERDFYSRPRTERNIDELEIDVSRARYPERRAETVVSDRRSERPGRQPDFLREDYARTTAGPLVVREREREIDEFSERGGGRSVRGDRVEKEEQITIRDRERRAPERPREREYRDVEKEEIIFRRDQREPERRPRERESEELDIRIRRSESEARPRPPPPRSERGGGEREIDTQEIRFRRGDGERRPPPRETREIEKEEIIFKQERRSSPPRSEYREGERDKVVIRERDLQLTRSIPPVARETEEFVIRRRAEPPPPPRDYEKEEIIIRRRERSPVREPSPEPPPRAPSPEPLSPVVRPPIVQEIITHHRHIDHGVERARSPSPAPPPAPPSPTREDDLEIEIRRRGTRNGRPFYDEDIIYERETIERKARDRSRETQRRRSLSGGTTRRQSPSPIRRRYEDDAAAEADFYNRKVAQRAYAGEGYNGATKDWAIVDVPPGTERVKMDGIGGGSQEITWQRYNGVRRSKFKTRDHIYEGEFEVGDSFGGREEIREERRIESSTPAPPPKKDKMWTEITKDLVIKEAIDEMGYEYEETEFFFYVIEYLRYEDVLHLVELTEDIRRERRERIREIQWEREEMERLPALLPAPPPAPKSKYDERIYEREYIYDSKGRRYR